VYAAEANDDFLVSARLPEPTGGYPEVPLVPGHAHEIPDSRTGGDVVETGRHRHLEHFGHFPETLKKIYILNLKKFNSQ